MVAVRYDPQTTAFLPVVCIMSLMPMSPDISMPMSPDISMPMATSIALVATMVVTMHVPHVLPGCRHAMAGIRDDGHRSNHHRRARRGSGHDRGDNHRPRRHDDGSVRKMMPQRNAEAHTRARLRRGGERCDCDCTNEE